MSATPQSSSTGSALPTILILAVLQGWAMYGLHYAIKSHHWPATDPGWLVALYAVVMLVPITLQLLVEHVSKPALWLLGSLLGVAMLYFGWHQGNEIVGLPSSPAQSSDPFAFVCVLLVWWLLVLPFVQSRLALGRWSIDYLLLFQHSWRNAIGLAEAAVFTGLFWMILGLWQMLFHLLGIDFFRDLFAEPIFIYPVTAVVFGCAIHLIGSIDRLVSAVLEQILNVLKWLATVAGVLLTLFTAALVLKLPGLVFTGQRAIGAAWLLWLVAVVVLFLNAAYRDGTVERPYPRAIAQGLRFCIPLMTVVAATACYALFVRTEHHGLTVERVWAFVVAGAALIYSVGYAVSAFGRGRWLGGVARVNVLVALALVATLGLALTPVLSPYRLAANSQYHLILAGHVEEAKHGMPGMTPFKYLRFDAGEYGRQRLEQLSHLQNHPDAERIRQWSMLAAQLHNSFESPAPLDPQKRVAQLRIYPAGHALAPELAQQLAANWGQSWNFGTLGDDPAVMAGVFIDLDGDGIEEFVLVGAASGVVYGLRSGHWQRIGQATRKPEPSPHPNGWVGIQESLAAGQISAAAPEWQDLMLGTQRFKIDASP